MDKRDRSLSDEAAFAQLLETSLPEQPPADVAQSVTPWRQAVGRILWGLVLTSVTVDFLCLNYILPAAGFLLLLLGFRALRRENRWMRACFVLSALQLGRCWLFLALGAALYQEALFALPWAMAAGPVSCGIQAALLFCFWRGLSALQRRAGLPVRAGSAGALLLWYLLLAPLAPMQYSGWIGILALLVLYYFILRSIYGLSGAIAKAGYCLRPAPVRLSDRALCLLLCLLLAAGLAGAHFFSSRYPMDWAAAPPRTAAQQETCARLAGLGFPEDVLADLTAEDLAACAGAEQVWVRIGYYSPATGAPAAPVPPEHLRMTTVAVRLPGTEEPLYKVFHHFCWAGDIPFCGTEAIWLQPVWSPPEPYLREGGITGQVLYTQKGTDYCAPYPILRFTDAAAEGSSLLAPPEESSAVLRAAFSYPARGAERRGYLSYTLPVSQCEGARIAGDWFQYIHQTSWLQYPVRSALSRQALSPGEEPGPFSSFAGIFQLYTDEDAVYPACG